MSVPATSGEFGSSATSSPAAWPPVGGDAYDWFDDMPHEPAPALLRSSRPLTINELALAQGVRPMVSTEEWAADIFESDDELVAFLDDLRMSRAASTS